MMPEVFYILLVAFMVFCGFCIGYVARDRRREK